MNPSLPDLCDDYGDALQVLEPAFTEFGANERFCGEVVTLKCYEDNTLLREILGEDGTGRVLVVDGGGSTRCALLGDRLAALAVANGWQGVVINGCVRDVEQLAEMALGIRALHAHPVRSGKRGDGRRDAPLHFAGASFDTGHFLYADRNGMAIAENQLPARF